MGLVAGQCLTLLYEARNLSVQACDGDQLMARAQQPVESMNGSARRYQNSSWDGSHFEMLKIRVKHHIAVDSYVTEYSTSSYAYFRLLIANPLM